MQKNQIQKRSVKRSIGNGIVTSVETFEEGLGLVKDTVKLTRVFVKAELLEANVSTVADLLAEDLLTKAQADAIKAKAIEDYIA